jgi:predicted nucleic acid-binding protein
VIVIDASVLVAALHPRDVNHLQSREWLRRIVLAAEEIAAPMILLSEVAGAITRRTSDAAEGQLAAQRILTLPRVQLFPVDARIALLAAQVAVDLRLRGADATYVAVAMWLNVPLVTWDREQFERGGRRVTVYQPDPSIV